MIFLSGDELCREIERFAPDGLSSQGVINLDIAVFAEGFTIAAALWKESCSGELFREALNSTDVFSSDIKNNHRYPNKSWTTLSKRSGRRICRTGYPVYGTIEELNQYKYLAIKLGNSKYWGDQYKYILFQIDVELTKDNPISGLGMHIKLTKNNPGIEIHVAEPIDTGGAKQYRYVAGEPIFPTTKNMEYSILSGTDISGEYYIAPAHLIRYEPAIRLYAQNKKALYL